MTLLPCPFCGAATLVVAHWFDRADNAPRWAVRCTCRAEGPAGLSPEEAVAAWNRRASYATHLPAVMAATEPEALARPLPMSALTRFGGRRPGGSCGCGGTLEQTRHESVAVPGWTLDCATCGASYDEDGNHWCPACETWPKRWYGGTDADPRPWCGNCGADQPGWPARPLVMAEAVEGPAPPCLTCRNSVIRGCRYACRMTTDADVWRYLCPSGALVSDDGLPTDRTMRCPGWAAKETT